jgi:hypothetical protein
MTTKTEILQYIVRLEQDLQTLKNMVQSMDASETSTASAESQETTPAVLIDTDSPEELIAQFLIAAAQPNESSRDAILHQLLHSSILKHPPAMDSFLRFSFKTLQNRWSDYLADASDPYSYNITRQQRNDRGELSDLRIYLQAAHRSPCPITFQQDPVSDMQWRVVSSSL